MQPMTAADFRRVKQRDFTNGAVRDEIAVALERREAMLLLVQELDRELDGVAVPASAAAILNALRRMCK